MRVLPLRDLLNFFRKLIQRQKRKKKTCDDHKKKSFPIIWREFAQFLVLLESRALISQEKRVAAHNKNLEKSPLKKLLKNLPLKIF